VVFVSQVLHLLIYLGTTGIMVFGWGICAQEQKLFMCSVRKYPQWNTFLRAHHHRRTSHFSAAFDVASLRSCTA